MSEATANGVTVIAGTIVMPRVGAWRADLELDLEDASKVIGNVSIAVGDLTFEGFSQEATAFSARTQLRVVGGRGGLGKPTKPRFYQSIPARVPLEDILVEGGEKLSSTSAADKTGTSLPLWTRPAGVVSEGLELLVEELSAVWRILPDGTVWVGVESWPEAKLKDVLILADAGHEASVQFVSDTPSLKPGMLFQNRRVSRVELAIGPSATRTTAWFDDGEGSADVLRGAIAGLVRQETKHLDYQTMHGAKVVSQNGDGTLELRLDSATLPGMSKVPIRAGVLKLKVKPGAIVTVAFLEASPAKPCVVHVDPKGILEASLEPTAKLTVNAAQVITQNGRPLARIGDMVSGVSTPPGTPFIGQIMTGNPTHRG